MKKKLAILLVLAVGLLPSAGFCFESPLKKYNLYDDVMGGGGTADPNIERGMSDYYNDSLRPGSGNVQSSNSDNNESAKNDNTPSQEEIANLERQLEGMEKLSKLQEQMNAVQMEMSSSSSLGKTQIKSYLQKSKNINKEALGVIDKYFPDDPQMKNVSAMIQADIEFSDKMINSNMSDDEFLNAMLDHQMKYERIAGRMSRTANRMSSSGSYYFGNPLDNPKAYLESFVSTTGRNADLRASSMQTYSNYDEEPQWYNAKSFYSRPSLESIIQKYRDSNFAGCMQEAESYVNMYPNDTLGYYYLAMSYVKTGNRENAVKAYEEVIALNDNPMIVKYATNGRNCVLEDVDEAHCYPNVNVAEIKYPFREIAATMDLTPIDVNELIHSNVAGVQKRLSAITDSEDEDNKNKNSNAKNLPFGEQNAELDEFINAPYGNGFSDELNQQYRMQQLKFIKQNINNEKAVPGESEQNLKDIKKFDRVKSDASDGDINSLKLAYDSSFDFEQLKNDPEYIRNKKEMDELNMLFGSGKNRSKKDLLEMIPALTDKENGMSPEMFSQMMMNSVMPDMIETDII